MSILTDVTSAALIAAIEENMFELFRAIGRLPGGELEESNEQIWFRTGLPSQFFNGVARTRGVAVEDVTKRFAEPFSWWTGPQSWPPDLDDRLAAAGLTSLGRDMPGMAALLSEIDEERAYPEAVEVVEVRDDSGIALWGRLFSEAHEVPAPSGEAWVEAARRHGLADLPWSYWIARLEGEPAGLGLSVLRAGVVGLYGIGTLASARRRGVGSALTLVPMLAARDVGYEVAVLQSTPDGEHLYPRLGFRTYCTVSRFRGGV